jgi:hypothetical protein
VLFLVVERLSHWWQGTPLESLPRPAIESTPDVAVPRSERAAGGGA